VGLKMGKENNSTDRAQLRRLAEKALQEGSDENYDLSEKSPEDMASLIHQLRVHQIELQMQNEELQRIQEELEITKSRYSHLYDFAPTGYITVNEKGAIAEANLTMAAMLGIDRLALIGKMLSNFILKDDQDIFYKNRQRLMETEAPQTCELRLVKKGGHHFFARLECMIIKTKNDEFGEIRAAVIDTSESKKADNERDNLRNQLSQSQKIESIGTLAGGIAHEFNNILTIIIGNNELVMDELPEWSDARNNTEAIRVACLRAKEVVKQLLLFSRQTDQKKMPIQIGLVVKESMKLIRSSTPANIDINQNIADDVAPILGNATQINQLLINLCSNSTDAMINTGGAITIDLNNETIDEKFSNFHASLSQGRYVKLVVGDSGHGMDKGTLDRIFEPYFTTKEFGKGTGIGLAVVHGIVERYNGMISAESSPGKGTVFTILLPVYEGHIEQASESEIVLPTGNERILLVDDEQPIFKLGKHRLESLGYKVQGTVDPSEALAIFQADPDAFDLVITDMAMPHMTGDQLVTSILKIRSDMPTILCTGYSEKISEVEARKIGIRSYAMKPLDRKDFAVLVRKVLDEAKCEGQ